MQIGSPFLKSTIPAHGLEPILATFEPKVRYYLLSNLWGDILNNDGLPQALILHVLGDSFSVVFKICPGDYF